MFSVIRPIVAVFLLSSSALAETNCQDFTNYRMDFFEYLKSLPGREAMSEELSVGNIKVSTIVDGPINRSKVENLFNYSRDPLLRIYAGFIELNSGNFLNSYLQFRISDSIANAPDRYNCDDRQILGAMARIGEIESVKGMASNTLDGDIVTRKMTDVIIQPGPEDFPTNIDDMSCLIDNISKSSGVASGDYGGICDFGVE